MNTWTHSEMNTRDLYLKNEKYTEAFVVYSVVIDRLILSVIVGFYTKYVFLGIFKQNYVDPGLKLNRILFLIQLYNFWEQLTQKLLSLFGEIADCL